MYKTKIPASFSGQISIVLYSHRLHYTCKAISLFQKPKYINFGFNPLISFLRKQRLE